MGSLTTVGLSPLLEAAVRDRLAEPAFDVVTAGAGRQPTGRFLDLSQEQWDASVGRDGLTRAMQRVAVDGVLLYRDDAAPTRHTRDGPPGDARFERGATAGSTGVIFEPDGDLAVTHGVLQSAADGSRAVYVRVWQRERRRWRLAIDLQAPLPAP
jgi:hypothetical protein